MSSSTSEHGSDTEDMALAEKGSTQALGPFREDFSLLEAARRHRVRGDRPTQTELAFFPDLYDSNEKVKSFLVVRNTALATWCTGRTRECTIEDVLENLESPYNLYVALVRRVVNFLTTHGLINFGRFTRKTKINYYLPKERRAVVVIGAGAAGIGAATQLQSLGFDPVIFEATGRIGGRAASVRVGEHILELGCDSLRNLEESPIAALLHQVDLTEYIIHENKHIFVDGKPVDPKRDKLISGLYENIRGALAFLAHNREERSGDGLYKSRQQFYENILNVIERSTLNNYYKYAKKYSELSRERESHFLHMKQYRTVALMAEKKLSNCPADDALYRRSLKKDLSESLINFDQRLNAFELCEKQLSEHQKNPYCKQYMAPCDYRNYNFFLGFEEFLQGTQLEKIQFSCNTNEIKPFGKVARLQEGISEIFKKVIEKRGIEIRYNQRIRSIDTTTKDYVRLRIDKTQGHIFMRAPFVVSTIPLGVLKKTIAKDERAPVFIPPLPKKKVEAIKSIGSGNINKLIMIFEEAFWATSDRNQFATVSPLIADRGTMLFWSSVPETKVLTTYFVGEQSLHDTPDQTLIDKAMEVLMNLFPNCPKQPLSSTVTRWHTDELAFGSGSFMGLRTELHHFDDIRAPLDTADGKPRVFFAGEHTSTTDYGTLDGAWMSGLRAAAELASYHNGTGFLGPSIVAHSTHPTTLIPNKVPRSKDIPGTSSDPY